MKEKEPFFPVLIRPPFTSPFFPFGIVPSPRALPPSAAGRRARGRSRKKVGVSSAAVFLIPLFHSNTRWIAYNAALSHPDSAPLSGFDLETWWLGTR